MPRCCASASSPIPSDSIIPMRLRFRGRYRLEALCEEDATASNCLIRAQRHDLRGLSGLGSRLPPTNHEGDCLYPPKTDQLRQTPHAVWQTVTHQREEPFYESPVKFYRRLTMFAPVAAGLAGIRRRGIVGSRGPARRSLRWPHRAKPANALHIASDGERRHLRIRNYRPTTVRMAKMHHALFQLNPFSAAVVASVDAPPDMKRRHCGR